MEDRVPILLMSLRLSLLFSFCVLLSFAGTAKAEGEAAWPAARAAQPAGPGPSAPHASILDGLVLDTAGHPLPFANVAVYPIGSEDGSSGSSNAEATWPQTGSPKDGTPIAGAATNLEGRFVLQLEPGPYRLVLRYVGYQSLERRIVVPEGGLKQTFRLQPQTLHLDDVVVRGDEDPAMEIMRKAIAKRELHRLEQQAFSVDAYVKGLQRIDAAPDRVLGFRVDAAGILDSSRSGIVYLSESISRLHVLRNPTGADRTREDMLASKVSGDEQAFSFNEAAPMELSLYEERIAFQGLSERPLVSPLAKDAFFWYRFRLEGSYMEEGRLVNRIEVLPKREQDPVFRGSIEVLEDSWRILATDLLLTREAGIEFIDSLHWTMRYLPMLSGPEKTVWMPEARAFRFRFGLLGIRGGGYFLAHYSNYDLRPEFSPQAPRLTGIKDPAKRFFGPERLRIEEGANAKDSAFWIQRRPIPLSLPELADYRVKDSIALLREDPAYLDSIDRIENKPEFMNLVVGYAHQNSKRDMSWFIGSPLNRMAYNTVEGWTLGADLGWQKGLNRNRALTLQGGGHYGFGNRTWMADARLRWRYDAVHEGQLSFGGGRRMIDYHPNAMGRMPNTLYTLWLERNFLKLYEERGGFVQLRRELFNGFSANATAHWHRRVPWTNFDGAKPWNNLERTFLSNDPQDESNEALPFQAHDAAILDLSFRYVIGQQYASEPDRRFRLGSKWPTLRLDYRAGLPVLGSGLDYQRLEGGLEQSINGGLWGRTRLLALSGGFLGPLLNQGVGGGIAGGDSLAFQDYRHFGGNRTVFLPIDADRYRVLPFFARSTTGTWVQVHAEHHFNGFLFNKIPGLRTLRWQFVAGGHYLWTQEHGHYGELALGIEHILRVFRIEGAVGWGEGSPRWGILAGFGF